MVLAVLLPGSAMADSNISCAILDGFASLTRETGPVSFDLRFIDQTPECSRNLEIGGKQAVTCGWAYDYRSDVAMQDFESTVDMLADCARFTGTDPARVSHPDSYDLRQFALGSTLVSVSLKDKGALDQTWLFLRSVEE